MIHKQKDAWNVAKIQLYTYTYCGKEEESDKSNTSSNLGEEVSQNVYYNDINKK